MADTLRVKYDELDQVATQFTNQSQAVQEVLDKIKADMDKLKNGGWIGKGSDAFFKQMDDEAVPATTRLVQALSEGNRVTKQISQTAKNAENEASSRFRVS